MPNVRITYSADYIDCGLIIFSVKVTLIGALFDFDCQG